MDDLIEALTIFRKYAMEEHPTLCEHDVLMISNVVPGDLTEEDAKRLDELSFFWNESYDCFVSFRFGSA
jgi:hypothetical protein